MCNLLPLAVSLSCVPLELQAVCWNVEYSAWDFLLLQAIHLHSSGQALCGCTEGSGAHTASNVSLFAVVSQVTIPHDIADVVENVTKLFDIVSELLHSIEDAANKLHPQISMCFHFLHR